LKSIARPEKLPAIDLHRKAFVPSTGDPIEGDVEKVSGIMTAAQAKVPDRPNWLGPGIPFVKTTEADWDQHT